MPAIAQIFMHTVLCLDFIRPCFNGTPHVKMTIHTHANDFIAGFQKFTQSPFVIKAPKLTGLISCIGIKLITNTLHTRNRNNLIWIRVLSFCKYIHQIIIICLSPLPVFLVELFPFQSTVSCPPYFFSVDCNRLSSFLTAPSSPVLHGLPSSQRLPELAC